MASNWFAMRDDLRLFENIFGLIGTSWKRNTHWSVETMRMDTSVRVRWQLTLPGDAMRKFMVAALPLSQGNCSFLSLLAKCVLLILCGFLVAPSITSAADPLGATPHNDGTTTFRVWAPFVDAVAVKINGGTAVPLAREAGHTDPADTTWAGTVPGAQAGDKYRYAIQLGGVTREFNDPRAQQLSGFDLPNGFGLAGMISPNPSSWTQTSVCRRLPSPRLIPW